MIDENILLTNDDVKEINLKSVIIDEEIYYQIFFEKMVFFSFL